MTSTLPKLMSGVATLGHGGPDMLVWRDDLPVPVASADEVVIKVAAAAVNNTDINTRIGWYSKSVTGATDAVTTTDAEDGGWAGTPLKFPLVQGADCCGYIVAVGANVNPARIGQRVIVRAMQSTGSGNQPFITDTFGSEHWGGFAQYTKTFDAEAFVVDDTLSDTEWASIPCAFSTAEGMLQRANVTNDSVLITGASGGVGAAAVQLAAMRGAEVFAMTQPGKADAVKALGAAQTLGRDAVLGKHHFDVVIDLVGGPAWPALLEALKRGGRYVTAGAIAGPMVELDLRTLYLNDLTLLGSTYQPKNVFEDLIGYVQAGKLRPAIAANYDLRDIHAAQDAFNAKNHVGKITLTVPQ
ncbi:zinc-binding dehydrogenase [Octadecabacter sp. G9-8]|uniref:Zinc-binding dehydrogenase n=1 Tax=Octadecabacter dasysiphoniae TaxID=2909341 RepID=A0ABS9CVX5_9RHOB|nr:zinc-binding dehydrogenase [Octadecabacter dasysiphoniae]MCF2870183.1 zinc-binding dehydrogenase [Octadecabacter dasysiphoniae]